MGAGLKGKNVLIIDDVITAGTAMRETIKLVDEEGGKVVGFVVALDRGEFMPSKEGEEQRMSAMGMIKRDFGVPTTSIVTLDDLIEVLKVKGEKEDMRRLEEYRKRWGARD